MLASASTVHMSNFGGDAKKWARIFFGTDGENAGRNNKVQNTVRIGCYELAKSGYLLPKSSDIRIVVSVRHCGNEMCAYDK